ncbi:FAD:protein FMN transferase [Brevinematales bacterium NS]|nr:FAD:protein FMN transferase [Brevinematales bacterium NS]
MRKHPLVSFSLWLCLFLTASLALSSCQKNIHRIRLERFQMNTLFQVVIYASQEKEAKKWGEEALSLVENLEKRYSLHLSNSLLFTLNNDGKGTIDKDLLLVWQEVERLFALSDGLFDPTVEPLMRLWGFYQEGTPRVPSSSEIEKTLSLVGFSAVKRDKSFVSLHGRRIDLGGILKGYALDVMAEYLKTKPLSGFLLNAGGNILVWGEKTDHTPWQIAIRHPRRPNEVLALFSLHEGSVATSGDYEQYFIERGIRYHHILNPKTGYPVSNGVISVTVVAPKGIESDGLSTVMFLVGKEKGIPLADKMGIGVCYIMEDLSLWTNRFFPALSDKP